jgi:hypothetical protein
MAYQTDGVTFSWLSLFVQAGISAMQANSNSQATVLLGKIPVS